MSSFRKPGQRSKRLRFQPLYEWLVSNHARLKPVIGLARDPDDAVFATVRWEFIESLGGTAYQGRKPTPMGVMMEWRRVDDEMQAGGGCVAGEVRVPDSAPPVVDLFGELDQALRGDALHRCALSQWMLDHHDWFAARLAGKRPKWEKLAQIFERAGLGHPNRPLKANAVRTMWYEARNRKKAEAAERAKRQKAVLVTPAAIAEMVHEETPAAKPAFAKPSPSKSGLTITPAVPIGFSGSDSSGGAVTAGVDPASRKKRETDIPEHDFEEELRKLDAKLDKARLPMPKPIR
jgi:hypothetical protein